MAESSEPKKETVRITVSPQPSAPTPANAPRDTVRIHLPTRPPSNPPPATDSGGSSLAATAAAPMPRPQPLRDSTANGPTPPTPKKETARITVLPDPPAKPAVQMKKTQPLIGLPAVEKPVAPVTITTEPQSTSRIESIPMPLCWALLAGSLVILILQIWNYLS